jgi:hypothetical protein
MTAPVTASVTERDDFDTTVDQGRACAVATDCLRDLEKCAAAHPALFPAKPFCPTLFSGITLVHAFACPDATVERIRVAARVTLWVFAADWLVDTVATSRDEIEAIADGCAAVGDGAAPDPGVPLQCLLAELRDELAATPRWAGLYPVWRDQLGRYLAAGVREWDWKAARASGGEAALPTFEDYLANADNLGATFVNVAHWIHADAARDAGELERLAAAGDRMQRALRLLNDLATYERDRSWGDLNGLMLGVTSEEVTRRLDTLVAECRAATAELAAEFPEPAAHLRRQLGYSTGYYGLTDYWGAR